MKTAPVRPARIEFGDGPPTAPDFGDLYHPRIGALAQARHVFLQGCGLPERWAGADDFTVLETGFGLGHNFLATWDAWRRDPARGARLHYVALDRHPPAPADLARAHAASALPELARALQQAWPLATPNLHPLALDGGRVRLLLGWGDVRVLLRELQLQADAVYLDGFAPDCNPEMWERRTLAAIARRLRRGACAATWSVARPLREALAAEGFEVQTVPGIGSKREVLRARYAPAFTPVRPPGRFAEADPARHALIVGGGLAGAGVARALAAQGWQCTVFDRHTLPAAEASGVPGALFHGTVHAEDGAHARFNRAAALHATRVLSAAFAAGVPGQADGLLRRLRAAGVGIDPLPALQAVLERQGLPPAFAQLLDARAAAERAGLPLDGPAWAFPGGGWAVPAALVRHWLQAPGIKWRGGVQVQTLRALAQGWQLLDADGALLAQAGTVVLANAADAQRLLAAWPHALPALQRQRGQLSLWPAGTPGLPMPRLPLAGDGYALALPAGGLLCGASAHIDDDEAQSRPADHDANRLRLARLTGRPAPLADPAGHVGWRVATADRLPVLGAVPALDLFAAGAGAGSAVHSARALVGTAPSLAVPGRFSTGSSAPRLDQARLVPRQPGLFVATALGSRGLGWAALAGEVLAAWICGTPLPLEADLLDAVDPARALVRQARRASRVQQEP